MKQPIVESSQGITLVGGAPVGRALFRMAIKRAPVLVAADSGADHCLAHGHEPQAVIGDMDSLSPIAQARLAARIHKIAEQDSTDFDKALRSIRAPFVLALGFTGARVDHELAAMNTLVRHDLPILLLGRDDILFHLPRHITLNLPLGERFSLFPMADVEGRSEGLEWPIDGLRLSPAGRVGTSNRVSQAPVRLSLSGRGMLCILPRARLDQALAALVA